MELASKETTDLVISWLVYFVILVAVFKVVRLTFVMCICAIENLLKIIFCWNSARTKIETFFYKLYYFIETGKFKDPRRRFDNIYMDFLAGKPKKY